MDAAGKDSAIKHVFSGINPQGCHVTSFKAPSQEELDHDYMWRCFRALPERGRIGIFNRSYYEEVLVVRVHDELLARSRSSRRSSSRRGSGTSASRTSATSSATWPATGLSSASSSCTCRARSSGSDSSHDSTSRRRTGSSPPGDVRERAHWNEYMRAYEQMIRHTATERRALVRGAGRSQVVHAAGRILGDRRCDVLAAPALSAREPQPAARAGRCAQGAAAGERQDRRRKR